MKVRTSVTLPKELLTKVDALTGKTRKRSEIVECALRDYMARVNCKKLNTRDIEIINEHAELINKQVEETLGFQAQW